MNSDTYQKLSLIRMSLLAIRRQVNEQLDAMDAEIASMIPEDKVKYGRKLSVSEMRSEMYSLLSKKKIKHGKAHVQ